MQVTSLLKHSCEIKAPEVMSPSGARGDHQKTAQLFEYEIGSGQDAQLKAFASDQLPVIFEHLRMARVLSDALAIQMIAAASQPQK